MWKTKWWKNIIEKEKGSKEIKKSLQNKKQNEMKRKERERDRNNKYIKENVYSKTTISHILFRIVW